MASRLRTHLQRSSPRRLQVEGDLDLDSCDELRSVLADLGTAENLIVDLSQVSFIDSTGLNTLLDVFQAYREAGSRFVVVDPSSPVRRIMELTGLDSLFLTEAP